MGGEGGVLGRKLERDTSCGRGDGRIHTNNLDTHANTNTHKHSKDRNKALIELMILYGSGFITDKTVKMNNNNKDKDLFSE